MQGLKTSNLLWRNPLDIASQKSDNAKGYLKYVGDKFTHFEKANK
jgi:hypothetical protein